MRGRSVTVTAILQGRMENYANPYHEEPQPAPLTRADRLAECALALLLTLLAVYLSR